MEENYNKLVGNRIKNLREQKGEYQKETAEAISKSGEKLSEGQLGLYEIGARKLPPNITKALAIHFNTTTDYILGRTDEPSEKNKDNEKLIIAARSDVDLSELTEDEQKYILDFIKMIKNNKKNK